MLEFKTINFSLIKLATDFKRKLCYLLGSETFPLNIILDFQPICLVALPVRQKFAGNPAGSPTSRPLRLLPSSLWDVPLQLPLLLEDAILGQQQGTTG